MRYLLPIFLTCLFGVLQPLHAQNSTDPGDLFVNAYMAVQQADKMEQSGNLRGALSKLSYARDVLDTIGSRFPSWSPAILNYRKQRTAESIARISKDLGKAGGGRGPTNDAGTAMEGGLPTSDDPLDFAPPGDAGSAPPPEPIPLPTTRSTTRKGSTPRNIEPDGTVELEGAIGRMKKLQSDLREANAAAERAEREKKDLVRKYDDAIQARDAAEKQQKVLQTRADSAEERLLKEQTSIKADVDKLKALQAEASEAKRVLRNSKIDQEADMEVRKQLNDRLQAAQAKIAAGKDAVQKIQQLQTQLDKANAEKKEFADRLAETKTQLATMTGQRDDAMKQLAQLKEAAKNVDKLVSDNASLMARLAETEKSVANFKAEGEEKDKQIAVLKKEVGSVKEQLAQARTESANYQRQMGDLQSKLEEQGKQLAQAKAENVASNAEKKKMQAENDILRGIVLRQQQQEARRTATKKIVLAELAKLEINSKTLLKEIDFLSQPVVKLTAKELELFKKPSLQVNNEEISANLPKSDEPLPTAEPLATDPPAMAEAKPSDALPEKPALSIDPTAKEPPMEIASLPTTPPSTLPGDTLPKTSPPMEPVTPGQSETPAPTETLPGSVGGTPNIPVEFLPQARDGKEAFEKGDYRAAEKIYEKILAKVPNNLYILSNLGVVRFRAGKYKQAEEVLIRATKVAPEDSFSHCTLGIVYYTEQKLDEAVSALTKALAINPKNATAHNYLGITAAGKGWQEAAQKELETACSIDTNYADAHFNLAVVFATQTPPNKEKARQYYKRATELGAEVDSALEQLLK